MTIVGIFISCIVFNPVQLELKKYVEGNMISNKKELNKEFLYQLKIWWVIADRT
jgi:hypothetical protein